MQAKQAIQKIEQLLSDSLHVQTKLDAIQVETQSYYLDAQGRLLGLNLHRCANPNLTPIFAQLQDLEVLSLRIMRLSDLKWIAKLKNLKYLNLAGNSLRNTQGLESLQNLEELDLQSNNLLEINEIAKITSLKSLYLSRNKLQKLPSLQNLQALTHLALDGNALSDLNGLEKCENLRDLRAYQNKINNLYALANLKELRNLTLYDNEIEDLSPLRNLHKLYTLDVSKNKIQKIDALVSLKELSNLDLGYNHLQGNVEYVQAQLPQLRHFELQGNEALQASSIVLSELPSEPGRAPDLQRNVQIFEAEKVRSGSEILSEAKIIFIGEPGAGKTSLRKKILNQDYQVPNEADRLNATHGLEISSNLVFDLHGKELRLHLWDFGGQTHYQALHHYFLTEGAFFILVVDERREDTDYEAWFQRIQSLGDSRRPLLIVYNHRSGSALSFLDLEYYQSRYPKLYLQAIDIDLSQADWDREALFKAISRGLMVLPHLEREVPKAWWKVRQNIEQKRLEGHAYLQRTTFFEMCEAQGIQETQSQLLLSAYLHRLGLILHHQEEGSALANLVILKPDWVVQALYKVIADLPAPSKNSYRFSRKALDLRWEKLGYALHEREAFLDLFLRKRFDLAYLQEDAEGSEYLVFPHLLPAKAPSYRPHNKFSVSHQVHYKFLPKGFFARLIVRCAAYLAEEDGQTLVWKHGMMLNFHQSRVSIISRNGDGQGQNSIDIEASGPQAEPALLFAKALLQASEKTSHLDLQVNDRMPCVCEECRTKPLEQRELYDWAQLQRLRNQKGIFAVQCHQSAEQVLIYDLEQAYLGIETIQQVQHEKEKLQDQFQELKVRILSDDFWDLESHFNRVRKAELLPDSFVRSLEKALDKFEKEEYHVFLLLVYPLCEALENLIIEELFYGNAQELNAVGMMQKMQFLESKGLTWPDLVVKFKNLIAHRNSMVHGELIPDSERACYPHCLISMQVLCGLFEIILPSGR